MSVSSELVCEPAVSACSKEAREDTTDGLDRTTEHINKWTQGRVNLRTVDKDERGTLTRLSPRATDAKSAVSARAARAPLNNPTAEHLNKAT